MSPVKSQTLKLIVHKTIFCTRPRSSSFFIERSAAPSKALKKQVRKHTRKQDEASQDLFFACISFVVLLAVAVADVAFRV
jgi:hypothetical protein